MFAIDRTGNKQNWKNSFICKKTSTPRTFTRPAAPRTSLSPDRNWFRTNPEHWLWPSCSLLIQQFDATFTNHEMSRPANATIRKATSGSLKYGICQLEQNYVSKCRKFSLDDVTGHDRLHHDNTAQLDSAIPVSPDMISQASMTVETFKAVLIFVFILCSPWNWQGWSSTLCFEWNKNDVWKYWKKACSRLADVFWIRTLNSTIQGVCPCSWDLNTVFLRLNLAYGNALYLKNVFYSKKYNLHTSFHFYTFNFFQCVRAC